MKPSTELYRSHALPVFQNRMFHSREDAVNCADRFQFPPDFTSSISRIAQDIVSRSNRAVVWGAASKGVIFSLLMQRAGAAISGIVDINPAKQGKFLAASGLQVWSPQIAMNKLYESTGILVMNSNYRDEIARMTSNRFNYIAVDAAT